MTAKKANATYPMDTKHTLSPAIAKRIVEQFTENKQKFTRLDFMDLAKTYNKNAEAVSRILKYMAEKNKIVDIDDKRRSGGGGLPMKVYRVVSDSAFADEKRIVSIEQHNKECGARLHEVFNTIVRMNAARV